VPGHAMVSKIHVHTSVETRYISTMDSRVAQWRKKIYVVLLIAASAMAIFVLVVTNTTMPLNDDIQAMSRQIRDLKDENRLLEMQIFEETRLELVDKHAMAQGMVQPKEIIFFRVSKGYDAF
jgi:cell division protein FtsL